MAYEQSEEEVLIGDFDHAVTFRAYENHIAELSTSLGSLLIASNPVPKDITDPEHLLLLSQDEIDRLWGLFPDAARKRAVHSTVRSEGTRWFSDVHSLPPATTEELGKALLPTAFALGHTSEYPTWDGKRSTDTIILNQVPDTSGFSLEARRISQAKVFVHEAAHTIINPEFLTVLKNEDDVIFIQPDGRTIGLLDFFAKFAETAEKYPPISNYSSNYRNPDNTFKESDLRYAIAEELCDSIAAYLLGFSVNPERPSTPDLTFSPFAGREDVRNLVEDYLGADRAIIGK